MHSYNLDYFIAKLERIPADQVGLSSMKSDVLTFFDQREVQALDTITRPYGKVASVNDGLGDYEEWGYTPHERVLTFLKGIKEAAKHYGGCACESDQGRKAL